MRTSTRNEVKAAASDSIDKMNEIAMKADRSQRRNAFTNSMTTTSEISSAEVVISVIAMLM
jgi:hypothetical protein